VSCQYFPCSFVLALRELGLRLGVKAQLPLRASSRGVLPGAPNALSVFISNLSSWLIKTAVASRLQIEIERNNASRRRGAAVVEPRYSLWGRAMHPGSCDSLHLPKKLCRGSPSPEKFVVICSLFVPMR